MHRDNLERGILELREQIVGMSGSVVEAMRESMRVLRSRDADAAGKLVEADESINTVRYDIEEKCLTLIATQQPVAGDLRSLFSILEIATEVERIGDYAKGIARISIAMGEKPLARNMVTIPIAAEKVCLMLEDAMKAFVASSAEAAREVAARDSEIDQLNDKIQRVILTFVMEDHRTIAEALHLTWVSHNIERAGDRIVNICERIAFTETGEFREFD
ncbi:phosphate signaling complex protein PhoU [Candidatus Fermentibacteria bacterium]|nr:phosphate signaling complex protein PhoU [Candidatus Fermentibacteria bacterium]